MKFNVITPTINRTMLLHTCTSIDEQNYQQVKHFIGYDGPLDDNYRELLMKYHILNKRMVFFTGTRYNDYGNSVRKDAWDYTEEDAWIGYCDDDDKYINGTFHKVQAFLNDLSCRNIELPDFVFFPCLRYGKIFISDPPKAGAVTSIQYFHKKYGRNGKPIRFEGGGEYTQDGKWLDEMMQKHTYAIMSCEPLVQVDLASEGKYF